MAGYGPLLMLLVTSHDIQTALEKGIQYQKLTHLFGTLSLQETENHIILNYLPVDLKQKSVYSVPNAKFRALISLFRIFIP